ncbi:MAG: hypothetical protein ACFFCD_15025 [Promethearchaeota archaeon]
MNFWVMKINKAEHKFWAALAFTIVFLVYFFFGSPTIRIAVINASFLGYLIVIAASHFPDLDLDFGIKYHRSPITHSPIIPVAVMIFYFLSSFSFSVLFLVASFFIGYSSHLFLDLIPPTGSAFGSRVSKWFEQRLKGGAPGDLRGIPEKYERNWLLVSGIIVAIFFVLTILLAHQFMPTLPT